MFLDIASKDCMTIDECTHAMISGYRPVENLGVKGNTFNVLNRQLIHNALALILCTAMNGHWC
jgi:hypothetical protein